ncbi:MAG TPA: nucleoside hydrolase [Patescibacteria group bacterium]|nr:nucleoside hydrolase [Patescibacteria group bacterium]
MKKQNIFIDTDMGNDDIMAISQLLFYSSINIVGISVVNGVATKTSGYENLQTLCNYLKVTIPSKLGYQKAISEKDASFPSRDITRANNLTLLKSLKLKKLKNQKKINKSVEKFIYENVIQNTATILTLGPLTNLAKTIEIYGEKFTKNVKQIVMMGGGINRGNVSPNFLTEYNIYLDPEAAQVVFSSGIPIIMVGIDATSYAKITNKFIDQIKTFNPKDKRAKIIQEIIINNDNDFNAFYDPLTAYLLKDDSIITKRLECSILVSVKGKNRGQTIPIVSKNPNVTVVMKVNPSKFYNQMRNFMIE